MKQYSHLLELLVFLFFIHWRHCVEVNNAVEELHYGVPISSVFLNVQSTQDYLVADPRVACYPTSTTQCNLRSAWSTCNNFPNTTTCIINLPTQSTISFNSSYGALKLNMTSNILIYGNNATILQVNPILPLPIGAPFPYTTGGMSNTNSAQQNYQTVCIPNICLGDSLLFSSCAYDTTQDTFFRLYVGSTQIASNDNFCGVASQIAYQSTLTGCQEMCLRIGCSGSKTCSTTVSGYIVKSTRDGQFISYLPPSTTAFPIPTIKLQELNLIQFGSISQQGAIVSVTGNSYLQLSSVRMNICKGNRGGCIYVSDNSQGYITFSNLYINDSICQRGTIYIRNSMNINIENATISNTQASEHGGGIFLNNVITGQVVNIDITNSSILTFGGGIYLLNIADMSFKQVRVRNTVCGGGGGFYLNTVRNSTFEDVVVSNASAKAAQGGGAIYVNPVVNCSFNRVNGTNLTVQGNGGAMVVLYSANSSFDDIYFANTRSNGSAQYGGAIYLYDLNRCRFENIIVKNSSTAGLGGSFYIVGLYNSMMNRLQVSNTSTERMYGSLYMIGGENLTLSNFDMTNSKSISGAAGCIGFSYVRHSLLSNITLTNCTALTNGGGMSLDQIINVTIVNSTISRSSATDSGGGLYVTSSSKLRLFNSTIYNNQATYGGGSYWDSTTDSSLIAVNITSNRAIDGGGAYLNRKNVRFMIMDESTLRNRQVVETVHPFVVTTTTNTFRQSISNANARGWIVIFDTVTNVSYATHTFVDGSGSTVYFAAGICSAVPVQQCFPANFPGISAPILYIRGNTFNYTLNASTSYYNTYCQGGCYGVKFYAYPVYSSGGNNNSMTHGNFIEFNTASRDGGGLQTIISNQYSLMMNVMVRHNVAKGNAGGMYFMTGNDGSVLSNIEAMNNTCSGFGGGINLFTASYGFQFRGLISRQNSALTGGGLYIGAGNGVEYGPYIGKLNVLNMTDAYFQDNIASNNGGGLYIENSNTLILDQITMRNNSATSGGGLYLSKFNKATFTSMTVRDNKVSNDGGGIYVEEKNTISIQNSTIENNEAVSGSGGGVYSQVNNILSFHAILVNQNMVGNAGGGITCSSGSSINLYQTTITGNAAASIGGGLYLKDTCRCNLAATIQITNNVAVKGGGGIAIYGSGLWTMNTSASLELSTNVAARGSALFCKQLLSSAASWNMENVTIEGNHALEGGTVYWLFDASMSVPPILHGVHWGSDNVAPYGITFATQAVTLLVPAVYNVEVYQQYLTPPITVQMQDYYGVMIPVNGSTTVDIDVAKNQPMHCANYAANLVESATTQKGLSFHDGELIFSDLQAYCAPTGNFTITFTANLGNLDGISVDQAAPYYISNNTVLQFRACKVGEYLSSKGECVQCAKSEYSLKEVTSSCESCFGIDGVLSCYGNQIILSRGYWRRFESNDAVLPCPLKDACMGGNFTGELLCATGYTGALCAVCESGYYSENGSCVQCSSGGLFSPVFIVIITALLIFSFVAIIGVYVFYTYLKAPPTLPSSAQTLEHMESAATVTANNNSPIVLFGYVVHHAPPRLVEVLSTIELYYLWCKTRYTQFMTQLKIVLSTYQIAMSTATVLSVTFPTSFMNFSNALSFVNVNISAVLPINCAANYSFIDQLIIATLTPIMIAILLMLMFLVEYVLERQRIQSDASRKKGDKQRAFDRIKDTYLNYLFYLSYLVLPSVTTMIFQTFLCTNIDPHQEDSGEDDYYLTVDMSISCTSTYYYNGLVYAIVMVFVYPIGIPLAYFLLLYYSRDEIRDRKKNNSTIAQPIALQMPPTTAPVEKKENIVDMSSTLDHVNNDLKVEDTTHNPILVNSSEKNDEYSSTDDEVDTSSNIRSENTPSMNKQVPAEESAPSSNNTSQQVYLSASVTRIAFLWQAYQPQYWYWEIIETTRRLMLTAVLSVCGPGTSDQTVFSVLLAMVYIKLYGYFAPYDNGNNNVLAEVGQFQVFFTFFGGMIMQANLLSDDFKDLVGFGMVGVNLAVVLTIAHFQYLNSQKTLEKQKSLLSKIDAHLSQKMSKPSNAKKSSLKSSKNISIGGWFPPFFNGSNSGAAIHKDTKQSEDNKSQAIELSNMKLN